MTLRASTEQRLLDAADELFFTRGITSTPIDTVLARAGVSAATMYRGYASKEALVAAALERRQTSWLGVWDSAVADRSTTEDRLLAVFDALGTFRSRPEGARWCAFLGSAAEYADPPEEIRRAVDTDTRHLRERLTELAAPLGLPPHRVHQLVAELVLLVTGDLAMRLREPDHSSSTARAVARMLVTASAASTSVGSTGVGA